MRHSILLFLLYATLEASPEGLNVVAGEVWVERGEKLCEIKVSDRAVLNWDSFSISQGETTRFIQPAKHSAVLNRVVGAQISELLGTLQSNGQVYLFNQNGIVIGTEGRIDCAGFVASALEIKPEEFVRGQQLHLMGSEDGSVIHLGSIESSSGPVALIAHRVENYGKIESDGVVSLASGHEILLSPNGNTMLMIRPEIPSGGIIEEGAIRALEVQIQADGVVPIAIHPGNEPEGAIIVKEGGRIYLRAEGSVESSGAMIAPSGQVNVYGREVRLKEGKIDVSGVQDAGEVLIGQHEEGNLAKGLNAQSISFESSYEILADAKEAGTGGHILLLSDGTGEFHGKVSATGVHGGGLVELSGRKSFSCSTLADVRSEKGAWGKVVHDPLNILIENGANMYVSDSLFYDSYISSQLSMGNYTISTAPDAGVIEFNNYPVGVTITWSQATTFQLIAQTINIASVNQNVTITNSSSSTTPFLAIDWRGNTGTGGVPFGTGITRGMFLGSRLTIDTSSSMGAGGVHLEGMGGPDSNEFASSCPGIDYAGSITTYTGIIEMVGYGNGTIIAGLGYGLGLSGSLTTYSGEIRLTGTAGPLCGGNQNYGVSMSGLSITSNATSAAGEINITGQGGLAGSMINFGVDLEASTSITSYNAPITITGYAGGTGSFNYGVFFDSSSITGYNDASLTIVGFGPTTEGGGLGPSSGTSNCHGIHAGYTPFAFESGNVSLNGTGKGIVDTNQGVIFYGGITTTTGNIEVIGVGSTEGVSGSVGIQYADSSGLAGAISSTTGNITITGTGYNTGAGVSLQSSTFGPGLYPIVSVDGDILITGTAQDQLSGIVNGGGSGAYTTGTGNITYRVPNGNMNLVLYGACTIESAGSGNIVLQATTGSIFIGYSIFQPIHLLSSGTGNISVNAGRNVQFDLGSITASSTGEITLSAGREIILGNNTAISADTGNIFIIAGESISAGTTGTIQNNGASSSITLVADNLYPTPNGVGSGNITFADSSIFTTSKINFYTSTAGSSTFPSLINGLPYTRGGYDSFGLYSLGTNEQAAYWYDVLPFPPDLIGYQIVYKRLPPPLSGDLSGVIQSVVIATTQTSNESDQVANQSLLDVMKYGKGNKDPKTTCRAPRLMVSH